MGGAGMGMEGVGIIVRGGDSGMGREVRENVGVG